MTDVAFRPGSPAWLASWRGKALHAVPVLVIAAIYASSWALPAFVLFAYLLIWAARLDVRNGAVVPRDTVIRATVVCGLLLAIAAWLGDDVMLLMRSIAAGLVLTVVMLGVHVAYPEGFDTDSVVYSPMVGLHLGWLGWSALVTGIGLAIAGLGLAAIITMVARRSAGHWLPFAPFLACGSLFAVVVYS